MDQKIQEIISNKKQKNNKIFSHSFVREECNVEEAAGDFLKRTKAALSNYSPSCIYNTDQSGFEREMRSKRTLSFMGEKHIESVAQSISALTHTYTIMPTISMDGHLFPKLFIVLQEPKGILGPLVSQKMFKAENLIVTASKSGKMGKPELKQWYKEAFFPFTGNQCALIIDSWTTYNDPSCLQSIPPEKTIELFQIPPGTTGKIQTLDIFFSSSIKIPI